MRDLFDDVAAVETREKQLAPGAVLLRGFALPAQTELLADLEGVIAKAPFRHMVTPGGFRMSVAMTNCGSLGWVTDRTGYRYDAVDPESGKEWPPMPDSFLKLAQDAAASAGFAGFLPDGCLINRYEPGASSRYTRTGTKATSASRSCRCRSVFRPSSCSAG